MRTYLVKKSDKSRQKAYHNCLLRPCHEGREGNEGREKRKPLIDLDGGCPVSFWRVIYQVAVKNRIHAHISRGKPIVTRARLGHTFGQSKK